MKVLCAVVLALVCVIGPASTAKACCPTVVEETVVVDQSGNVVVDQFGNVLRIINDTSALQLTSGAFLLGPVLEVRTVVQRQVVQRQVVQQIVQRQVVQKVVVQRQVIRRAFLPRIIILGR